MNPTDKTDPHHTLRTKIAILALLLAAVLLVYGQTCSHEFINFDDPDYVYKNPHLGPVVTLSNIIWAFTSVYAANWHPVTWISHMLDVQFFGLNPSGHHLTSVALHAVNSLLLFLLLCRLTGAVVRSAVVAAVFALHPLHVESVAWVAERKDVLSTLFWMLTLYLYAGYVERPGLSRYIPVVICFLLGLMAKPMLVTLPLVMLLLDRWPLARVAGWCSGYGNNAQRSFWYLIKEKIPFVVLAALSCCVTVYSQQAAMTSLVSNPLSARVANAVVAYVSYLGKTFWPKGLAVFYPFPVTLPLWQSVGAAGLLSVITLAAFRERRRRPYLLVGWLWFLCTLIPVIGIVRVGLQSMADRYMYVPQTGIIIMVVLGVVDLSSKWPYRRVALASITGTVLAASVLTTWRQVSYWQNNTTLYSHALAVTQDNFVAHNNMGFDLASNDRYEEAINHYNEAIRIAPWHTLSELNLGVSLRKMGKRDEAVVHITEAIRQNPEYAAAYNELGAVMLLEKKYGEAVDNLTKAVEIDPGLADGHYNLGLAYGYRGNAVNAIEHYRAAIAIKADDIDCRYNLGIELARLGRYDEAIQHFTAVLRLKPDKELEVMARQSLDQARQLQTAH